MLCCRCRSAPGSVLPITTSSSQCGLSAPLDHHLRPVTTYSSPSRSIRVEMFPASEDATSGSVMQKAERTVPSSSGSSHSLRCASVPNISSTSMFPVSGAEQFSASGARKGLRPVISASGAYWRLVSPAPAGECGRKRFHRPWARAFAFSSSSTGGRSQRPAAAVCSAATRSAG